MIVPCRGLDTNFHENIASFFKQDYDDYTLFFVVDEESDEAYPELCKLRDKLRSASRARDIQILVAGPTKSCSQKTHNLLYAYEHIDDSIEVLAFADSDAFLRSEWLSHIVYPLRHDKNGAASGYRWFVPIQNNLASLALSGVNAKIAQLLGNTRFNQAWGGSMAIRVDTFRTLELDTMWSNVVSDDYALTYAVKKSGRKVAFVPACIVASHETMTWWQLFEFARRQLVITRISMPGVWWFGLGCILYSVLGLWGCAALAIWGPVPPEGRLILGFVALVFFLSQMIRAVFRQRMIAKLLARDRESMRYAGAADIFLSWAWSLLLLVFYISSAFGRTICWRGIKYKMHSLTNMTLIEKA
jgi:cellulose synthase/poly-beta-1,6-N-acetylglucosamine synthase-like glycosyltransferase